MTKPVEIWMTKIVTFSRSSSCTDWKRFLSLSPSSQRHSSRLYTSILLSNWQEAFKTWNHVQGLGGGEHDGNTWTHCCDHHGHIRLLTETTYITESFLKLKAVWLIALIFGSHGVVKFPNLWGRSSLEASFPPACKQYWLYHSYASNSLSLEWLVHWNFLVKQCYITILVNITIVGLYLWEDKANGLKWFLRLASLCQCKVSTCVEL